MAVVICEDKQYEAVESVEELLKRIKEGQFVEVTLLERPSVGIEAKRKMVIQNIDYIIRIE